MTINGKIYPLWQHFTDHKEDWIGGTLTDAEEPDDMLSTEIVDVILRPNGKDSAWFEFEGKDFSCGFDSSYGGISGSTDKTVTFMTRSGGYFVVTMKS